MSQPPNNNKIRACWDRTVNGSGGESRWLHYGHARSMTEAEAPAAAAAEVAAGG